MRNKSAIKIPGAMTLVSLELPPNLPFEQWQEIGKKIFHLRQSCHWFIGDWLVYGEQRYGESYAQALDQFGYSYDTLRNDKYVAQRFTLSRRRDKVPWSHHEAVASLPSKLQDRLLDAAEKYHWTREELREEAKRHRTKSIPVDELDRAPAPSEQITAVNENAEDEMPLVSRLNFAILVECEDADDQSALLARFAAEGLDCRPYNH